jgi:hypothetical protein
MVFWFKIDFSVILTKNCIFENKTFLYFLLFLKLYILYLNVIQGLGKINQ